MKPRSASYYEYGVDVERRGRHVTFTAAPVGTTVPLRIHRKQRFLPYRTQWPRAEVIYPLTLEPAYLAWLRRALARRVRACGAVVVRDQPSS